MILSVSRRTDIPCYYSEWFMNRLNAGYVLTRNPMNPVQINKIQLSPDIIDCIVFWTKDALKIIPYLTEMNHLGYKYYFQFTLTPYDTIYEKNLRYKIDIENTFIELSKMIGKEKVLWRYDPIIMNDFLTMDYHKKHFLRLCEKLHAYTESVTISFVDKYTKLKTNLIREITDEEMIELSSFIRQTARNYELTAKACCEKMDLAQYGITEASCIDKTVVEKICGYPISVNQDKNQRTSCGCVESIDIGSYNTCLNGCIYCYANNSIITAERRNNAHNPRGEMLVGAVNNGEVIKEREVKSNKRGQTALSDIERV